MVSYVAAVTLVGCGGSITGPNFTDRLVGDWSWVDASGGLAGVTLTPESEGYDQTLRFGPSPDVELFRDGVSMLRTPISYFVGDDGGFDHIRYGSGPFGFPSSAVDFLPGDTLLLVDPCCDGFVRRWVRRPLDD
jgi:hypothetical protein